MTDNSVVICWLRRDLRLYDNTALYFALKSGKPVLPLFIFDTEILNKLENKSDRRVDFIHQALQELSKQLKLKGSSILIKTGKPEVVFAEILQAYQVEAIYTNRDYEPCALARDLKIKKFAIERGVQFLDFKDQVIFEPDEILKADGTPYSIYTPYSKIWKKNLSENALKTFDTENSGFYFQNKNFEIPDLTSLGFKPTDICFQLPDVNTEIIQKYHSTRDFPGISGTTHLSVHLRFGTISPRKLVKTALEFNETWLNELIWREFFMSVLYHFPKVVDEPFQNKFKSVEWSKNIQHFEKWCNGQTGYPIVDAGMRELNATGWMHNRVRMITANFLTKILMIDYRWGEAWFAEKLIDFDLALNNGNWQWSAGCGCDAAPYFRIFNPTEQIRKFDPDLKYIRKWVPEFESFDYPQPIVDYSTARNFTLNQFKNSFESIKTIT